MKAKALKFIEYWKQPVNFMMAITTQLIVFTVCMKVCILLEEAKIGWTGTVAEVMVAFAALYWSLYIVYRMIWLPKKGSKV